MGNLVQVVASASKSMEIAIQELGSDFQVDSRFIGGLELSSQSLSFCNYLLKLKDLKISNEKIRELISIISEYAVKEYGEKFVEISGEMRRCRDYRFDRMCPVFASLEDHPKEYSTPEEVMRNLSQFSFIDSLYS